jgi:hypothetical protein
MVILRNVIKENDTIRCDYFPEGNTDKGTIEYNYKTDEVIRKVYASEYDDDSFAWYYGYALLMLKRITTFDEFKSGVFKEEYPAFWY